ncbi:MAG: DUF4174 domain-containing protein [Phycisphaerales bacterium]|nr:DUF4174 domain-containing protein [Phycisphaerales bacterium]
MPGTRRFRWTLPALLGLASKCFLPGCAPEPVNPGAGHDGWFEDVRWEHRLLVISGNDESAAQQCRAFRTEESGMLERDLIVVDASRDPGVVVVGARADIPPAAVFRDRFRMPADGFQVVLVGKDGGVKERRDERFETEEVFRIIDAMPMRMQEMREGGGDEGT